MSSRILAVFISLLPIQSALIDSDSSNIDYLENPDDREPVLDATVYPYMATVLMGGSFVSCGALVDQSWVLTSAEGADSMRQSQRLLRIRLGSVNYRNDGVLLPVKLIEIHPYYNRTKPGFDLALIMLAHPARFTQNLRSIALQTRPQELTATHFIVTSWPGPLKMKFKNTTQVDSLDMIKRHRLLTMIHLHPEPPEDCEEQLMSMGVSNHTVMCLEPSLRNPCLREYGAPVVLNNVLWGIISSWKPEDCENISYFPSVFATLVSQKNVSSWIHATVDEHRWDNYED